ncbi:MAG TPA: metallophosphoesterase [Burkholderiales bacterium]|nr:metallophosphoesterase [Burkholderiales bacterium]
MKLNILSDLHLSVAALDLPRNDADVVILAGDIARPVQAVSWASAFEKPVLYVPGNHEFYGRDIRGTVAELKRLCAGTQVRVLDNDEVILGDVRFLGTTLWTDFMLFGRGDKREAAIRHVTSAIRDFSRILVDADTRRSFSPAISEEFFARNTAWLRARLAHGHAGPTVVISHHAPSRKSIAPRFADSPLNVAFVSDAEHLMDGNRVRLWIHGHTHDSFDYEVNGTRVVCNPRGYAKNDVNENPRFDPDFSIAID